MRPLREFQRCAPCLQALSPAQLERMNNSELPTLSPNARLRVLVLPAPPSAAGGPEVRPARTCASSQQRPA